ncbi:sigma-70 family RNA polymerase sigma factor [Mucilaginibacter sp. ZT4R22]|uniref:RNA polymerase sigma factor SigS n=1 Tax=Mucilaginibacter pankratovii TaxID=2772110 RepID=A0ABR7WKK8_9SPHI|nr:sigma-70 family RNA polymerase sigma factor [Mucilaginibacter pankratovii]MBD1362706.1 sigma-70 family RNA polymerase sigma factor [Mucilaginibacter pankratovii]
MPRESLSDEELLTRLQRGEHNAFDILFDRYWQPLYQTARARLNDSDMAQDIVQEIFIKIWQRRSELQIKGPLENYLRSAVRLNVINHYRSAKVTIVQLDDALERINLLEDSIESLTDYLELEKTLQLTVELMPEMLKKVYQLRSENRSVKAIAGELGLADQTVKNYIGEVSRRLRVTIAEKHPEKHLTYMALILAMLHK